MSEGLFSPEVGAFFDELTANNTREWFEAHRDEWSALVREPLEVALAVAESRYGPGRLMRINRDLRFSADKTPYHSYAGAWAGEPGAVFIRVSGDGISVGGGLYEPSRDQLARGRDAIAADADAAAALERILAELQAGGYEIAGPALTTAPRGYPKDHPRIELLRLTHYAALRPLPLTAPLPDIEARWSQTEPLLAWVTRHVGAAQHPS